MKDEEKTKEQLIEELKELRRQIGAEKRRRILFEQYMNFGPTVAFMKDQEGCYVYTNQPFEYHIHSASHKYKYSKTTVIGKTDFDLWSSETARQFRKNDKSALAANTITESLELIPQPDGEQGTSPRRFVRAWCPRPYRRHPSRLHRASR